NARLAAREINCAGNEVCEGVIPGFDEKDVGGGRSGVGPFNIECGFELPVVGAGAGGIDGGIIGGAVLGDLGETWGSGDAEGGVEGGEVGFDGGRVIGGDDGDGLAGAIGGD